MAKHAYVPAAGHDLLLPLYDPLQRLLGGDGARQGLIDAAGLRPGHRVLDVGCGTGSLVLALAGSCPDLDVTGLDPDPKALARARRKAARASVRVRLEEGFSQALPFQDGAFDRVFSTFMYHHLDAEVKAGTLAEARRVLRAGGELHLLDFARAGEGAHGFLAKVLHAPGHMHGNENDAITEALAAAGFDSPRELSHRATVFGRIAHFVGRVPAAVETPESA